MQINVSLHNSEFKNRKVFVLDVIDDITSWKITKRYSQILELHDDFKTIYPLSIVFPKKKIFGSMDRDVIIKRAAEFNKYFESILQIDKIKKSNQLDLFIRTDIYLEHFIELRDAYDIKYIITTVNNLKNKIKYTEETNSKLLHELDTYTKRCSKIKNDLSHFYDRIDIIERNSNTILSTKTNTNIERKKTITELDEINKSIDEIFKFIEHMIYKNKYPDNMHTLTNSISKITIFLKSIDNMILDMNDTRITDAINSNKYKTLLEKLSIFKISIDEFNECAKGII